MSKQDNLPGLDTSTPPRSTPVWLALPFGMVLILVAVLVGAIVSTVARILFILLLVPLMLIALILGLIDELRGKKQLVPKGVSKPGC